MTVTRKERIESLAKTIYLSGCTAEDSIYQAKIFIDAIDALPAEPATARAPDTTTPLRNGDKVKVIGLSRDGCGRYQWQIGTYEWVVKFGGCAVSFAGGVGSIYPRSSLDGPLNRQPDHIAEINARVDEVFGKPVEAANAAMKAGKPPTAEESSADRTIK
jgi:hypothetical protein